MGLQGITMNIVFHIAGGIFTEEQCLLSCARPKHVPPSRALWCGECTLVFWVIPGCHKLYRHHLPQTMSYCCVKTKCHLQVIRKKRQTQIPEAWPFYNIPTQKHAAVDERQAQQLVLKQRDICNAVGKEDRWDVSLWKGPAMTAQRHFTETDIRCWGGGVAVSEREVTCCARR